MPLPNRQKSEYNRHNLPREPMMAIRPTTKGKILVPIGLAALTPTPKQFQSIFECIVIAVFHLLVHLLAVLLPRSDRRKNKLFSVKNHDPSKYHDRMKIYTTSARNLSSRSNVANFCDSLSMQTDALDSIAPSANSSAQLKIAEESVTVCVCVCWCVCNQYINRANGDHNNNTNRCIVQRCTHNQY